MSESHQDMDALGTREGIAPPSTGGGDGREGNAPPPVMADSREGIAPPSTGGGDGRGGGPTPTPRPA